MKLIKITEDNYIIVDNSEIKEGDWFIMNGCIIRQCDYVDGYMIVDTTQGKHHVSVCKKITHSTQPFELLSENGLSGMGFSKVRPLNIFEVKELIGEVDVENRAESRFGTDIDSIRGSKEYDLNTDLKRGFVSGYNQALEDNKEKKYTEEDMMKAWNAAYIDAMSIDEETYKPLFFEDFIQSLQTKTEWEVEFIDSKLKLK